MQATRSALPSSVMPGLGFKHMRIGLAKMNKFVVCASFANSSFLQHIDAVSHPHGGKAMADKNGRPFLCQLTEIVENRLFCIGIHGTGRFVKNDDLCIAQKCARQGNLLPLANTQFFAILELLAKNCFVTMGQGGDDVLGT